MFNHNPGENRCSLLSTNCTLGISLNSRGNANGTAMTLLTYLRLFFDNNSNKYKRKAGDKFCMHFLLLSQ